MWALFILIEVRRFDATVTGAVMTADSFVRFIYFAAAAAAVAFGLAKFYEMHDTPTWVFVISTALAFGNLSAATITSVDNAAQRWEFFGVSLAWLAVALGVQTLCDSITGWSTLSTSDDDTFARGLVRLWVLLTWMTFWIIWFVGPFGLQAGIANTHVFEQSWYLGLGAIGILGTGLAVLFSFSPMSASIRSTHAYKHAARHSAKMQRALMMQEAATSQGQYKTVPR